MCQRPTCSPEGPHGACLPVVPHQGRSSDGVGELSEVTDLQVSAQTVRLVVTSENEIDDTTVLSAVEEAGSVR